MGAQAQDPPYGVPPALVAKSVFDLFYDAALHGQANCSVTPAEGAALIALMSKMGLSMGQSANGPVSIPVTPYQMFLPAFEQFALFSNGGDMPFAPVAIAPLAAKYLADKASADLSQCNPVTINIVHQGRGDRSLVQENDFTLLEASATVCDILIINGLDAPLTCADSYIGHGFQAYYPQVLTPIDHGEPVEASNNVIPGRTCMPDGTNRFGLGIYRFQKGSGAAHGTEGALKFTTPDPAAPQAIGIAWGLDFHNTPSMAATADLSQYNSLQSFYEATTAQSKSTSSDGKFGVSINCNYTFSSMDAPNKDDGHRVITVVIQPTGGVKETNADTQAAPASPLPAMLKSIASALPKPQASPAPNFVGKVNPPGPANPNKLPPNVVPFVNDDD